MSSTRHSRCSPRRRPPSSCSASASTRIASRTLAAGAVISAGLQHRLGTPLRGRARRPARRRAARAPPSGRAGGLAADPRDDPQRGVEHEHLALLPLRRVDERPSRPPWPQTTTSRPASERTSAGPSVQWRSSPSSSRTLELEPAGRGQRPTVSTQRIAGLVRISVERERGEQLDEAARLPLTLLVERPLAVRPLPRRAVAGGRVADEESSPNAFWPASSAAASSVGVTPCALLGARCALALDQPAGGDRGLRPRELPQPLSATTASWCSPITSCRLFSASTARAAVFAASRRRELGARSARAWRRSAASCSSSSSGRAEVAPPPCEACAAPLLRDRSARPSTASGGSDSIAASNDVEQLEIARRSRAPRAAARGDAPAPPRARRSELRACRLVVVELAHLGCEIARAGRRGREPRRAAGRATSARRRKRRQHARRAAARCSGSARVSGASRPGLGGRPPRSSPSRTPGSCASSSRSCTASKMRQLVGERRTRLGRGVGRRARGRASASVRRSNVARPRDAASCRAARGRRRRRRRARSRSPRSRRPTGRRRGRRPESRVTSAIGRSPSTTRTPVRRVRKRRDRAELSVAQVRDEQRASSCGRPGRAAGLLELGALEPAVGSPRGSFSCQSDCPFSTRRRSVMPGLPSERSGVSW